MPSCLNGPDSNPRSKFGFFGSRHSILTEQLALYYNGVKLFPYFLFSLISLFVKLTIATNVPRKRKSNPKRGRERPIVKKPSNCCFRTTKEGHNLIHWNSYLEIIGHPQKLFWPTRRKLNHSLYWCDSSYHNGMK